MALALRARIFVGFGIALLLLGVVSWFSYQNAADTVASARWVAHTREALETLDALVGQVASSEAAYRDFLIWGQESSLRPLDSAFREAPRSIARLRALTADNPAQQQSLGELGRLVAQRIAWGQQVVDTRRARGAAAAQRFVSERRNVAFTAAFHDVVTRMKATEERLLEERTAALNAVGRRTQLLIVAGTALALLVGALATVQVSRDLAARQRAEQVLREAEARFHALVEGVKDYAIFWLDPDGRVMSWNASAERQVAEQALRVSEERFRTVSVTANDAIVSADGAGNVTYLSPGAERILGLAGAEVTGRPITV